MKSCHLIAELFKATEVLERLLIDELKKYQLTKPQYRLLSAIHHEKNQTIQMSALKQIPAFENSDLSRITDRLVSKKLLVRKTDKNNRKKVELRLNKAGFTIVERISQYFMDYQNNMVFENVTSVEQDIVEHFLKAVRKSNYANS